MSPELKKALWQAAVLGVAGYVAYRLIIRAGSSARKALTTAGEALGSGLYDLFHKNQAGELQYLTVTFPDGTRGSVPAGSVTSAGYFMRNGTRYRLLVDKSIVSGPNKFAFPE